ncbi:MAG: transposase [Deltaproteobacteria bacterium]|nr:MAG: transposase [Deltaproteobacteria bacterium]
MQQKPMSLIEFQKKFVTEKACHEHLFRLRWPDGHLCPRCHYDHAYFHRIHHLCQRTSRSERAHP